MHASSPLQNMQYYPSSVILAGVQFSVIKHYSIFFVVFNKKILLKFITSTVLPIGDNNHEITKKILLSFGIQNFSMSMPINIWTQFLLNYNTGTSLNQTYIIQYKLLIVQLGHTGILSLISITIYKGTLYQISITIFYKYNNQYLYHNIL